LQVSLNVDAVKDERQSKIEEGFRKEYAKYIRTLIAHFYLRKIMLRNVVKTNLKLS
jgi:hypothetical protein